MRSLLAACLLALAPMLPATAQNSGLDSLDQRTELLGWEAVGRLDLGSSGFCSGVLIASDTVLTAAHCLTEARARGDVSNISFRAGLSHGQAVAERRAARAVLHPDYAGAEGAARLRYDLALVILDAPVSIGLADPFRVSDPGAGGREVSVVSYAKGREEAPSRQARCVVKRKVRGIVVFDCDVTFGASGAPVFDLSGPRARIVTLVSAGRQGDRHEVYGPDLPVRLGELKAALRAGRGVFPQTSQPGAVFIRPGTSRQGGAKFVRP